MTDSLGRVAVSAYPAYNHDKQRWSLERLLLKIHDQLRMTNGRDRDDPDDDATDDTVGQQHDNSKLA